MSSISSLIFFFLFSTLPSTPSSITRDRETDRQALTAFRASTNDPLNSLKSWNLSTPLCQWNGVTCNNRHQRVVGLNLANQNLTGVISPYIGNLTFLKFLHLDNNAYTGNLPIEFGYLKRLENFTISTNLINGEIPSTLSNCTNLLSVIISYNKLLGNLPPQLGLLSKLEVFAFSRNNVSGPIPSTYGNLSSLTRLYGGSNDLSGEIPISLGRLTGLQLLAFGENRLSGFIPNEIFNLSYISTFDLAANQLQGTLPPYIGSAFPNLKFFSVGINLLTGSIPTSFSNLTNLTYLHFGYNNFSGKVPSFVKLTKLSSLALSGNLFDDLSFIPALINATNLVSLGLNDNNFGGKLPVSFWNLSTTLSNLFLTDNQLTGSILPEIGKFINLQDLRVNNNRFTGPIPSSIGNLQSLRFMDFSNNMFLNSIPSSIGNLSNLLNLYLSFNNLSNSIPSSLANCQNLLELNLSRNLLIGSIDREVSFFGISSLRTIDLSQNQLNNTLPLEIGNLKNLEYFNVSGNNISGKIPSTLGGCVRLEFLDMKENSLEGNIPSSLSSLRGLQILDLSYNELNGPIPEFLEEFSLKALSLSFNDFDGKLSDNGIFKNASLFSVIGNPKLCGGISDLKLPKCNLKQNKQSGLSSRLKIVISTICVLLGITMIIIFLILTCLKRRKKVNTTNPYPNSFPNVSYQTLLKATEGFSQENLLGLGSYGSVYKGILGDETKTVAVKVLNLQQHGSLKSFLAECEALRNIRHRNLVRVLTACSGVDFQGNDFKALVYEFMSNGSLDDWLHKEGRIGTLDLVHKLNVAIDVACAVDYLHVRCGTNIVHCDIKPSNVLLDGELVAHVGDFGLARFVCRDANSFSMQQMSGSTSVQGTIGYTAPEYGTGSEPSTYGDVYSFGILLLEMFTGKRPTDEMFIDGFGLHSFVQDALPDRVLDIVDPTLVPADIETATEFTNCHQSNRSCLEMESQKVNKCLVKVLGIGVACSADNARERMNISDAVSELQSIRNALLRDRNCGDDQMDGQS